jgi:hypothetical protein
MNSTELPKFDYGPECKYVEARISLANRKGQSELALELSDLWGFSRIDPEKYLWRLMNELRSKGFEVQQTDKDYSCAMEMDTDVRKVIQIKWE